MPPPDFKEPIIIVGGGIAGLALARMLTESNIPYRLVEQGAEQRDGGLALNLPGNAILALARLGLGDQIETTGRPLRRREYRTAKDKILFEVDEDAFWGPTLRPRSVRRSALLSMLTEGLAPACLSYDSGLQAIELHPRGPKVRLHNGGVLGGSLIVGADGVRSTVRREMYGHRAGCGRVSIADASWRFMAPNPGVECWTVWVSTNAVVLLMPVGVEEVYGWAAVTSPTLSEGFADSLMAIAADFPGRVQEALAYAIADPGRLHHSPLEEVRLDRWHGERVVLIGDAAHATAPVWAQGAALGMEDAIVLGRQLAETTDIAATLAEFEAKRRPRVTHVQAKTDAMSKAARLPVFLRNRLLPFIGPKSYREVYGPLKDFL